MSIEGLSRAERASCFSLRPMNSLCAAYEVGMLLRRLLLALVHFSKRLRMAEPARSGWIAAGCAFVVLAICGWGLTNRLQADDSLDFLPGLAASLSSDGGMKVERVDRVVRLSPSISSPDPRLAGSLTSATWSGYLMSQNPGRYQLSAFVSGKLTLRVAGQTILNGETRQPSWLASEPLELDFDWHPLEVEFEPAAEGAELSLYWNGPGFNWEPIGSSQLYHDPEMTRSGAFSRGSVLARALRCDACHHLPTESSAASATDAGSSPSASEILPAPSLRSLAGSVHASWLSQWLAATPVTANAGAGKMAPRNRDAGEPLSISRRMPYFRLSREEQSALSQFLLSAPVADAGAERRPSEFPKAPGSEQATDDADDKENKGQQEFLELVERGKTLFLSLGCLACHEYEGLGQSGLFGGGDLTLIARKRPATFFAQWLRSPAELNPHHRMPVYELEAEQVEALATFLAALRGPATDASESSAVAQSGGLSSPGRDSAEKLSDDVADAANGHRSGLAVFERFRCGACHEGPAGERQVATSDGLGLLTTQSVWDRSCAGTQPAASRAPSYALSTSDQEALRVYFTSLPLNEGTSEKGTRIPHGDVVRPSPSHDGTLSLFSPHGERTLEQRLLENNCVGCHSRGDHAGLSAQLPAVAEHFPKLAEQLSALSPPSLNSVGDKLQDEVLRDVVAQRGPVHRPWLQVRMPRYRLSDMELEQLVLGLIARDRIPNGIPRAESDVAPDVASDSAAEPLEIAAHLGARLVTADGFGCTSCHAVGRVQPPQGPLNTLGPNLAMLEKRIRRPWFDRWVRNPARIVPRMEMPSVQTPVPGVLGENLDTQLTAVWKTLNEPNFRPPAPNPVRTLRLSGLADPRERPLFVTEVTKVDETTYIKPLLVGLANRHNLLFDLQESRVAHWWLGDAARQRTLGKTWFWEPGSPELTALGTRDHEWQLDLAGVRLTPQRQGQFLTEFDELRHLPDGIELQHRLHFSQGGEPIVLRIVQRFLGQAGESHWTREIDIAGVPSEGEVVLHLAGSEVLAETKPTESTLDESRRLVLDRERGIWLELLSPGPVPWNGNGFVKLAANGEGEASLRIAYHAAVPVDLFPPVAVEDVPSVTQSLRVVPGFASTRLPLPRDVMPTGLAWDANGHLVIASFKGQVWRATDHNGDGLEETLDLVGDGLAAPYGIAAGDRYVDVTTRYGLLRLLDEDHDGFAERTQMLYSGWGHTDDYHDWTVGLPRDEEGNYYVSIACQQDKRSLEAARMRGTVLRLVPRVPTSDNPHRFAAEVMSIGHRFPMGIARNQRGDLFTTDNQGNYKPFNQLNHVLWGADYGFINAVDRPQAAQRGTAEPAAIEIPHPWTRSVNGICFLETPAARDRGKNRERGDHEKALSAGHFGPFEGHLIGCEYDTRRLIRMSLERIGDTYQGAAYPFSLYEPIEGPTFLGPLVCQVSPHGDLYVGCIRDSGWGGANNVGGIVKMSIDRESIPPGVAEVRALATGFEIEFTQPVSPDRAREAGNYSVSSYRRVATPAYGGADRERRQERIQEVELDESGRRVRLRLESLRKGAVYEFHVRNLAGSGELFFPAEAHYTLRVIPTASSP
jgi:mono/diheme cytochrome c family protein